MPRRAEQLEQEAQDNARILEAKNSGYRLVVATIQHDGKNKIGVLRRAQTLFERGLKTLAIPAESVETLEKASSYLVRGVDELEGLLDGMDDVARVLSIDAAGLELEMVNLRDLVEDFIAHSEFGEALSIEGRLGWARVHRNLFLRILDNLVKNAFCYNDKPDPRVKFSREGDEFIVTDNGPGFPVGRFEDLKKLGKRGSGQRGKKGKGRGMAIIDMCSQLQGIGWRVESRRGKFTKMIFNLGGSV